MKAIVLLSGGVDSTVVLALALKQKRECIALSFNYGQRHKVELKSAEKVATHYKVVHRIINIDPLTFDKSALVSNVHIHKNRTPEEMKLGGTPSTYVPARNTLFLAYALGQAEIFDAQEIYFGPNALDTPYVDCRTVFISAFQNLMYVATKQAVEGNAPMLITPLIEWDKSQIIQKGLELNAPLDLTFSCYDPSKAGAPCLECDACILREEGFKMVSKI